MSSEQSRRTQRFRRDIENFFKGFFLLSAKQKIRILNADVILA